GADGVHLAVGDRRDARGDRGHGRAARARGRHRADPHPRAVPEREDARRSQRRLGRLPGAARPARLTGATTHPSRRRPTMRIAKIVTMLALALGWGAAAGAKEMEMGSAKASPVLEPLAALSGSWEGQSADGKSGKATYQVVSA